MAKRRQWMDELKSKNDDLNLKKKPKIEILSEIIYRQGTLIETQSRTDGKAVPALPSTPHRDKRYLYEELTPTFRSPNTYLQETKEVLKQMTPCKIDNNNFDNVSQEPLITNRNVLSGGDLELNNCESNFNHSQLHSDNSSYMVTVTVDPVQDISLDTNSANGHLPETVSAPRRSSCNADALPDNTSISTDDADILHDFHQHQAMSTTRNTSCDADALPLDAGTLPDETGILPDDANILPDFHQHRAMSTTRSTTSCDANASPVDANVLADDTDILPDDADILPNPQQQRQAVNSPRITPSDANGLPVDADVLPDPHQHRAVSVPRNTPYDTGTNSCPAYSESNMSQVKSHSKYDSPIPGTSNSYLQHRIITQNSPHANDTTQSNNIGKIEQSKGLQHRKSKRKLNFNKSFLDFIDEENSADTILLNEAFPSEDSGSWDELSDESSESEEKIKVKKSKNKKKLKKKKTIQNIKKTESEAINIEKSKTKKQIKLQNNKNKQKGESYTNTKGKIVEGKEMKENPCIGKLCQNNCAEITEERRSALFTYFWGLESQQRRKDWIAQATVKRSVRRSKFDSPTASRRSVTYSYYINEGESRRQVCQKFLMATLNVSQRFILYTAENSSDEGFARLDQRGKHASHNKTPAEVIEYAKTFIYSLPLLPSHYCRKDSKRLYLPDDFKNITNLYSIYAEKCREEDRTPMPFKVFSALFKNSFNIAFHVPKKDKCTMCSFKSYDVLTEEEMNKINRHLKEKDDSQKRFLFHQNLHEKDRSLICASFDLQKVLNTPHGTNMSLYYSRKIAVYNFTIYESGTRNGFCNVWTETDAHRGANEISRCLFNYITNTVDKRGNIRTLLLYCDSCFGQNKNKIVLAMLRYALSKCENLEVIQINYLIPGHTYMPVDSMHATIERAVRKSTVWAPSQCPTIMEMARKNPFHYEVRVREGNFFMSFNDIVNKLFKKNQNLHISTISVVVFKKNKPDVVYIKRSMAAEAECSEVPLGDMGNTKPKENLYRVKLPISSQKYKDLKTLVIKKIIPSNYAKEFLDLDHSNKTVDRLPDTDEEE